MNFKIPANLLEWHEIWHIWGVGGEPGRKRARSALVSKGSVCCLSTGEGRATGESQGLGQDPGGGRIQGTVYKDDKVVWLLKPPEMQEVLTNVLSPYLQSMMLITQRSPRSSCWDTELKAMKGTRETYGDSQAAMPNLLL